MNERERRDELLAAYLDGELPAGEAAAFERELEQDAALRAKLDAWRALGRAVREEEVPAPPADLTERITRRLGETPRKAASPKRPRRARRPWLVPAAAAVVTAGLLGVVLWRAEPPGVESVPKLLQEETIGASESAPPSDTTGEDSPKTGEIVTSELRAESGMVRDVPPPAPETSAAPVSPEAGFLAPAEAPAAEKKVAHAPPSITEEVKRELESLGYAAEAGEALPAQKERSREDVAVKRSEAELAPPAAAAADAAKKAKVAADSKRAGAEDMERRAQRERARRSEYGEAEERYFQEWSVLRGPPQDERWAWAAREQEDAEALLRKTVASLDGTLKRPVQGEPAWVVTLARAEDVARLRYALSKAGSLSMNTKDERAKGLHLIVRVAPPTEE